MLMCDVLVAPDRRHSIAEDAAEDAAHATGALVGPGRLNLAQDGERLVRRTLCSALYPTFATGPAFVPRKLRFRPAIPYPRTAWADRAQI